MNSKVSKIKKGMVSSTVKQNIIGPDSGIDIIKQKIRAKEIKSEFEKQKKIERKDAMERRKMAILEKLIQENERNKKSNRIAKIVPFLSEKSVLNQEIGEKIRKEIASVSCDESKLLAAFPMERKRLPPPRHKHIPVKLETLDLDGPPFEISKTSVDFVDYDPCKKYSQKIDIVNISRRVNTFKVLSFPLEYTDIFSFKIDPPGYVNPGMKTHGKIFFHPHSKTFSEDIDTHLILVAEWGGNVTIPISCKKKRSNPVFKSVCGPGYYKQSFLTTDDNKSIAISPRINSTSLKSQDNLIVDFGECTEGDPRCLTVEIENQGALPCEYLVKAPECEFEDYAYELDCERESTLSGYGKMKIKITFTSGISDHTSKKELENEQNFLNYNFSIEYGNGPKLNVSCTGSRANSSIQVEPNIANFDLCCVGQTYRQKLIIINHINISTKIWITAEGEGSSLELNRLSIQSDRIGDIEIHPSIAFVQGNDRFPIWLSIIPNSKAAEISNDGDNEFELSIRVNYIQKDGKKNYTPVFITGRITGNKLNLLAMDNNFGENILDFGNVSVLECKYQGLQIENASRAPQEVELSSNDPRIIVLSDDKKPCVENLILQPKSRLITSVRFEPDCYGPFLSYITAKNRFNQKFKINVRGFGHVPPLKFLNDQYLFPDISEGTQKTTIVILKRNGFNPDANIDYLFEFGEPFPDSSNRGSGILTDPILRISPLHGVFSGKKTVPIEVALTPTKLRKEFSKTENSDQIIKKESAASEIVYNSARNESFFISYIVPCYLKQHLSEADRMITLLDGSVPERAASGNVKQKLDPSASVIYFKISANIFPPEIVLCQEKIDFGMIPLGEKNIKSFFVRNVSDHNIILKSRGLNPSGGFFLAKALREIHPGQIFEIKIAFRPDSAHVYMEYFELITSKTTLKVKLDGEGIFPELYIEANDRSLEFENTIIGETSVRKIKIWNKKHYKISFIVELVSLLPVSEKNIFAYSNWNYKESFSINHKRAILDPNSFFELEICFQPSFETDNYFDILRLCINGNKCPLDITLLGRGWESSSFLSGYELEANSLQKIPADKNYVQYLKNATGIESFSFPDATGKGTVIDEENLAILAQPPHKNDIYFSTLTCDWKKSISDLSEENWELDLKEIIVMNVKPSGLKLESGKRSTDCEFIIEPIESTFKYNSDLDIFVMERSAKSPTDTHFTFDLLGGSVPIDSSLHIKLKVVNPIKSYWQEFHEKWAQYGAVSNANFEGHSESDSNETRIIHPRFQKQVDAIKTRLSSYSVSKPVHIESCFRITLKGGYRYTDPKGPMSPYESRIWILKVISKIPE